MLMLVMSLLLIWSYFKRVLELQCDNFAVHCLSFSDVFAFIKHPNYNRIVFFPFRDGILCCVLSLCACGPFREREHCVCILFISGPVLTMWERASSTRHADNKYVTSGLLAENFHSTMRLRRLVAELFFFPYFCVVDVALFLII